MRFPALSLLTVTCFAFPLYAQNSTTPQPAKVASVLDPILAPVVAAAEKVRAIQKTLKADQKFASPKDDARQSPSLELNEVVLKIVNSPTTSAPQKRAALNLWDGFYGESINWKPALNKSVDARPFLDGLALNEKLGADETLLVVLWRGDLELSEKKFPQAREVLEKSLLLKKLNDRQKVFVRYQIAQLYLTEKNHTAAMAVVEKIPVDKLDFEVQQASFDGMLSTALSQKNYDGAKAIIDVWAKRDGLSILNYAMINGVIFEGRGNLPAALGVYKGILPSVTDEAEKKELSANITRLEAQIAAAKPQNP